jgi:pre-mRNA-splicing factor CWC22
LIASFHIFDSLLFFPVVESEKGIEDRTDSEADLVNLRRVIYLTIMNALNYEVAVHKLLKIGIQEGHEVRVFFLGFVA